MKTEATQKNELHIIKCHSCRKVFRTDNPNEILCPECIKFRQPSKPSRKKKAKKKILTFAEILHLANIYYKVNNKYIHYGEMVRLIDSNAEHCVCCGATIPEGRQICPTCEKVGEMS